LEKVFRLLKTSLLFYITFAPQTGLSSINLIRKENENVSENYPVCNADIAFCRHCRNEGNALYVG
jgi:hypothetical protein